MWVMSQTTRRTSPCNVLQAMSDLLKAVATCRCQQLTQDVPAPKPAIEAFFSIFALDANDDLTPWDPLANAHKPLVSARGRRGNLVGGRWAMPEVAPGNVR
jgi:hypothetical protein